MTAAFAAIKTTPKPFIHTFTNIRTGKKVVREVAVETKKDAPSKK